MSRPLSTKELCENFTLQLGKRTAEAMERGNIDELSAIATYLDGIFISIHATFAQGDKNDMCETIAIAHKRHYTLAENVARVCDIVKKETR